MADDERRAEIEGAPGRDGDKLYCLCDHDRTYCPHVEGRCPWWDREPVDVRWTAVRSPQGEDHEAREGVELQAEIGPAARQRSGPGTQEGRS